MQRMHRVGISVHQKSFCGRAPPGPARVADSSPPDPFPPLLYSYSCITGEERNGKEGGKVGPQGLTEMTRHW